MKPDEKYMSEVKSEATFKFTPPSFDRSFLMENENADNFLDLYPDETTTDQLYCYYNSLNGCKNETPKSNNSNRLPETFEVLRGLDLDIDETTDLNNSYRQNRINEIYSEIIDKNPGIEDALSLYGMPSPIRKVITKRLIKLSLLYNRE